MKSSTLFVFISIIPAILCQGNWWDFFTEESTATSTTAPNNNLIDYYDDVNDEGVCCECVPFYLCSENNTIIEDGVSSLDPRIGNNGPPPLIETNVENCSDVTQFCCRVSTAPVDCMEKIGKPVIDPVRINNCECFPWEICSEEYIVSDGTPPVTTLENGQTLPNHAKCPHSLEVCCNFEKKEDLNNTDRSIINPTLPDKCVCVNPWLCDEQNFVVTEGLLPHEIAELYSKSESSCAPPLVCCNVRKTTSPVHTTEVPPVVIEDQHCYGIRNNEGISVRISGFKDGESQFGEYPWVGMILSTFFVAGEPLNNFLGGAILIHPRVMLTAAHKVHKEVISTLSVRVGEWDVQTELEPGKHQIREVERVIVHPAFNEKSLSNDVALVILQNPVVLQPHIRSICMAQSLDDVDTSKCVINGWGEDSFASDNYQTVMKSVTLPIVPHRRCQAMLRKTRLGRRFRLHPSFICAGGEKGKDACRSDGGGPLACPRKDNPSEYLLVGITAWGIGCGEDGVPGVYASTLFSRQWISDTIAENFPNSHNLLKREVSFVDEEVPVDVWRSDLNRNAPNFEDNFISTSTNIPIFEDIFEPSSFSTRTPTTQTTTPIIQTTTEGRTKAGERRRQIERERELREKRRRHPPQRSDS